MIKLPEDGRYLYCPKCKDFPETTVSEETTITRRAWDGECYQGYDTECLGGANGEEKDYCGICDTKLIDKSV